MTKSELEDCLDRATEILTEAYAPESSREELATAVGAALDALAGDTGDEDEDDEDGDQD
jgi:hypothetical protein